jgi:hypothetical protein
MELVAEHRLSQLYQSPAWKKREASADSGNAGDLPSPCPQVWNGPIRHAQQDIGPYLAAMNGILVTDSRPIPDLALSCRCGVCTRWPCSAVALRAWDWLSLMLALRCAA